VQRGKGKQRTGLAVKKTNRIAAVCLVYEEEIKSCLRVPGQDKQLSTEGLLAVI
jgi:hypothetical protein